MCAGLDTSALVHGRYLAYCHALDLGLLDHRRHLLRVLELVLDRLRASHRHQHAGVSEAVGHGKVEAVLLDVGNHDCLGASSSADGRGEEADCAGAEDEDSRVIREAGTVLGVHGHGEGLDEGAEVERHVGGEPAVYVSCCSRRAANEQVKRGREEESLLVTPLGRVVDALLQRALEVRKRLCRAAEAHAAADVVAAVVAVLACVARDADLESNAVTRGQVLDSRADRYYSAAGLVAQRQGLLDNDVAVAVVVEVVQVGAAEASRLNSDLHLGSIGGGQIAVLLNTKKEKNVRERRVKLGEESCLYQTEILDAVKDRSADRSHCVCESCCCCCWRKRKL